MRLRADQIILPLSVVFALSFLVPIPAVYAQTFKRAKQGYSMRVCFDNRGSIGRTAYPGVIGGTDPGGDSIGVEYPIGQPYEHVFGAGLWVGGILDTSTGPTPAFVRGVTTGYEGWIGPYFEFYPGSSAADTIWGIVGRGVQRPASWDAYWGNSISHVSFSDNDRYCIYDDHHVNVASHVRLRLGVVQSSFVWNDPYAEAVHIVEYKIVNKGVKQIDSAYIGIFLEGDVGPYRVANYAQRNYTAYFPDLRTAYIHNPVDLGSTPVGLSLIYASVPLDSLRYSYRWWQGSSHPNNDAAKYNLLSSGRIDSNQSLTSLADTRCLLAFGPFTLQPIGNPNHDTIVIAVGLVSGQNLSAMRLHADRARIIYENGGSVDVKETDDEFPSRFVLFQNYPNPFNPTTTIRFTVPRMSFVKITVFDVLGEEVAILAEEEMTGGTHSRSWDATGRSSGVYFYRLEVGAYVETKKLVLLR